MSLQPCNIIKYEVCHPLGLSKNHLAEHPGVTPVSINDIERTEGEELPKKSLKSAQSFSHEAQSYATP